MWIDIKQDNILFTRSTLTTDGKFDAARILDPDNVVLIDYGTGRLILELISGCFSDQIEQQYL